MTSDGNSVSLIYGFSSGSGLVIEKVDIAASSECFEDGVIRWMVCAEDNCAMINKGKPDICQTYDACVNHSVHLYLQK